MDEPWLDSLSEDWASQPTTSPAALASAVLDTIELQQDLPGRSDQPRTKEEAGSPASLRSKLSAHQRLPLLERSNSDINISSTRMPIGLDRSIDDVRKSNTSTLSAGGSVLRHRSVALRKSRSSSPPKTKGDLYTPEWKWLLKHGPTGMIAHNDLFSPINLEGIFQRPDMDQQALVKLPKPIVPLFSNFPGIPSSPPPWPKSHKASGFTFSDADGAGDEPNLNAVEGGEELPEQKAVVQRREGGGMSDMSPGSSRRARTMSPAVQDTIDQSCASISSRTVEPTLSDPLDEDHGTQVPSPILRNSRSLERRQSSSLSAVFSPVFISKHTTAEGGVDYSALDLSNPQVIKQMKDLQHSRTARRTSRIGEHDHFDGIIDSENEANMAHVRLDALSSPAYSSSIVPSDSVSQVNTDRGHDMAAQELACEENIIRSSSPQSETPVAQTPPRSAKNDVDLNHNKRSPGSPLKLFANHDTFTNNRLLSRLTQLHNDGFVEDGNGGTMPQPSRSVHRAEETCSNRDHLQPPGVEQKSVPRTDINLDRDEILCSPFKADGGNATQREQSPSRSCFNAADDKVTSEDIYAESSPAHDAGLFKRSARSPFEQPTPKRQRTLNKIELAQAAEYVSRHVEEQHNHMHAFVQSMATNSPHQQHEQNLEIDPLEETSLGRTIPVPNLSTFEFPYPGKSIATVVNMEDLPGSVHTNIGRNSNPSSPDNVLDIQTLASQVATIYRRATRNAYGSVRKQSTSTQDYMVEAMQLMDVIRSKPFRYKGIDTLDVSNDGYALAGLNNDNSESAEIGSRPPSRDGQSQGWRSRNDKQLDPQVISHLRKYQETGDDSFRVSSALQFPSTTDQEYGLVNSEGNESQSYNIRITGPKDPDHESGGGQSPVKTHPSQPSTDSSGRTMQTHSSQRTRAMPVIAPGKVSHLISSIESAAGMRFDTEKQTWVKDRKLSSHNKGTTNCSSSVGTEDDPFGHIPDLSINDLSGLACDLYDGDEIDDEVVLQPRPSMTETPPLQKYSDFYDSGESRRVLTPGNKAPTSLAESPELPTRVAASNPTTKTIRPSLSSSDRRDLTTQVHHVKKGTQGSGIHTVADQAVPTARNDRLDPSDTSDIVPEDSLYGDDIDFADNTNDQALDEPTEEIAHRRPTFSSPPVSREYPPRLWHETAESSTISQDGTYPPPGMLPIRRQQGLDQNGAAISSSPRFGPSSLKHKRTELREPCRSLSISRIDEHHEVSLIGTRPDGRSMSLTFSISTPLNANRHYSTLRVPSNNVEANRFLHSLSPLSEFTIHQDDARHLETRHLLPDRRIVITDRGISSAAAVNQLVTKLTDAEPEQPYWDALRTLNLNGKHLDHLDTLGEFCPSLEELDASSNHLHNLNGVPSFVRHLNVQANNLSGVTHWGHLMNLQYLDLSGNDVDSLDGLGNLLHLRELKVNQNNLASLEGIFDLDSLLTLSAKANKLSHVDFQSADLRRLTKLDMTENRLIVVDGLRCLPRLDTLMLDKNNLRVFPLQQPSSRVLHTLRYLSVTHNQLSTIDILQLPNLHILNADNNKISSISNLSSLKNLQTLKLRNQNLEGAKLDNPVVLEEFREVRNLYLSGNGMKCFPINSKFLNLQVLELALAGLQTLPANFGTLVPNLRVLNLNFNAIKDLKPLRGISRLRQLMIGGNRLSRLRRTLQVVRRFEALEELDLRDNPFSVGFYPPTALLPAGVKSQLVDAHEGQSDFIADKDDLQMEHVIPSSNHEDDRTYVGRLDDDTKLRRKVYELLLAVECKALRRVDGLAWNAGEKMARDKVWETLLELGVVERVGNSVKEG